VESCGWDALVVLCSGRDAAAGAAIKAEDKRKPKLARTKSIARFPLKSGVPRILCSRILADDSMLRNVKLILDEENTRIPSVVT